MKAKFLLTVPVVLLVVSCAQDSITGDTYTRSDTRQAQNVNTGYITSIRPVKIEGGTQTGGLLGAVAGGFLGSNLGNGRTAHTAGTIGGALAGAAVGSHAEQALNSRKGIEIAVRFDGGRTVSVAQEINPREQFQVRDRVAVLSSGSGARVAHSSEPPPRKASPKPHNESSGLSKPTRSGTGSGHATGNGTQPPSQDPSSPGTPGAISY